MKNVEKLLKQAREIEQIIFDDKEEARHYAYELSKKMQEEEAKLYEEKRKLDDAIWELRHKESKVFNYYLGIK